MLHKIEQHISRGYRGFHSRKKRGKAQNASNVVRDMTANVETKHQTTYDVATGFHRRFRRNETNVVKGISKGTSSDLHQKKKCMQGRK